MKAILGFAFFLLFMAGIAFVMLQGRQMVQLAATGSGAEVTGIKWRPVTVGDESVPEDTAMYVRFEVDGSIEGHGGCNGFFGSLEQTDSGVGVGPLGTTRVACAEPIMSREMSFLDAVQKTSKFDTGRDDLRLLDDGDNVLAEFVADADD